MTSQSVPRRPRIFSPLVFSQVSTLVAQGLCAAEIAEKIGCSLGTLRVKCSQHGISLRRCCDASGIKSERNPHARIVVQLSPNAAVRLQQKARNQGTTGPRLAAAVLEAVVHDNLYDAVIDREASEIDRADTAARFNKSAPSAGSQRNRAGVAFPRPRRQRVI
jgi:hypothetical protein